MRLDLAIVRRGLLRSRTAAQDAIAAGDVRVNCAIVTRPSVAVDDADRIVVQGRAPFVSRAGLKLAAALDSFAIDPSGCRCLDIGASTGGFTDCLLQRGAAHVTALDVGHGQLDPSIAADPRVTPHEGVNARYLPTEAISGPFDLIVIDVSFISLALILPAAMRVAAVSTPLVALIKPQFEVGRDALGPQGVVRSGALRRHAVESVIARAGACGIACLRTMESPITGGDGNVEFLGHFVRADASS